MPSINTLTNMAALGGGAAFGGYMGWRKSGRDGYDGEDRLAFTGSAIAAGAGAGLVLKTIGIGNIAGMGKGMAVGLNTARKALMANPIKAALMKGGRTKFGLSAIPKGVRGPLAGLAMLAGGIAAVAYGSRSNPQTNAYASNDNYGDVQYNTSSVKERMGMLGAAGEMVFGMHNMRHG